MLQLQLTLRQSFPEHGPLINSLLEVLHYMGADELSKDAFCREVVLKQGEKFWKSYARVANEKSANAEERFNKLAAFLEKSTPTHLQLRAVA